MIDVADEPTAAANVNASETEAPTEHAYAWALDDETLECRAEARRRSWRAAAAIAASLLICAGAAAVLIMTLRSSQSTNASGAGGLTTAPMRPDDATFLALLIGDGIPLDDDTAIAAGASVCRSISRGEKPADVAIDVQNAPGNGLSDEQVESFVADAITAYCPHAGL